MPHIELPFEYQYSPLHFTNYHHPLCFRSVHRLHLRPLTSYPTVSYPWTPCPVLHSPQVCTYCTVSSLIMMNIKECVYIIIARSVYIIIFARSMISWHLCAKIMLHTLCVMFSTILFCTPFGGNQYPCSFNQPLVLSLRAMCGQVR